MHFQEENVHFTKKKYSSSVQRQWEEAQKDEEARRLWEKARREHDKYNGLLESVNIDDFARPNYESSNLKIQKRKLIVPSKKEGVDVVADFAGGYMRLQIRGTNVYLDKNWQPVKGTTNKDSQRLTHFRIKKMEEM